MTYRRGKYPHNLTDAIRYFSQPDVAMELFIRAKWRHGEVRCPRCESAHVKYLGNRYKRWECQNKHPRRQFTVKVDTIMNDSPLGLEKWAVAMWIQANAAFSISSYDLHRRLGITQKTAWFLLHRIREAQATTTRSNTKRIEQQRTKSIVKKPTPERSTPKMVEVRDGKAALLKTQRLAKGVLAVRLDRPPLESKAKRTSQRG